jgi:tRNA(Arg) A34 adenosine deaminase TadA
MTGAAASLRVLPRAWQIAFGEAWAACCAGNFGVGAALIDPETDAVVTVGRNRVAQTLRHLAGRAAGQLARAEHPELATFDEIIESGTVDDALDHIDQLRTD